MRFPEPLHSALKGPDGNGVTFRINNQEPRNPAATFVRFAEVMMVAAPAAAADGGGGSSEQDPRAAGTPTLVEVNTRWHLTDFAPLTDACVGYNAVEETLSAYLDADRFGGLPRVPPAGKGSRYGRVVHLVSYVEGQLKEVLHQEVCKYEVV